MHPAFWSRLHSGQSAMLEPSSWPGTDSAQHVTPAICIVTSLLTHPDCFAKHACDTKSGRNFSEMSLKVLIHWQWQEHNKTYT